MSTRRMRVFFLLFGLFVVVGARTASAATETGTLDGAAYRVDIPDGWKRGGGLVVFFHGYSDRPVAYSREQRLSPMFDPMLGEGY
ncbi:MAG TPA: hypothetical protein VFS55_10995, partial [Dokdonella sp.]|nr:hypothetical protein [Dokdonella sp.]